MDGEKYDWRDEKDIDRFVADWRMESQFLEFTGDPDPLVELRTRFARGDFAGANQRSVEAYLKKHEERAYKLSADAQADREDRAVRAAEQSAKWAGWALVISLAALALAAWPYIKEAL